jgi:molybdenum cofactor biosynthesis enzyme MoaA
LALASWVRLTGGELLLRRGLVEMVRELGGCGPRRQPLDIAITTNGHLLANWHSQRRPMRASLV